MKIFKFREVKEHKDKQVINCAAEILIEANTPKHWFNHSALEERKETAKNEGKASAGGEKSMWAANMQRWIYHKINKIEVSSKFLAFSWY